ncbi:homocysteine methyltransferase, partial [Rhizobium ruizarguesonis]
MAKYRHGLPPLQGGTFITAGGLETTMIFPEGIALTHFASL